MNSINQEIHSLAYNCTEKVYNVLRKDFSFSTSCLLSQRSLSMFLIMDKPSKRKPAKQTLSSKEAMESELNRKLHKSTWVPVQPAPLAQSEVFMPPVGVSDTAAPTFDGTSNMVASSGVYPDEGYNYGDRYGGYPATRYNSTQVDDEEADARADYRYHQYHQPAPEYVCAYSAPYSDPNARGQGLCTSHDEPQIESQAPKALDRMERIMERMERQQAAASSASSKQLQAFIGQGEFFSIILLKIFENLLVYYVILSMESEECYTLYSTLWKEVGQLPASRRPVPNYVSGPVPKAGVSGAKMCGSEHCLVFT
jgi:hypothetical protein